MGNIARPEHFRLTDKAFDLLSDPSHLAKVKKLSKFTPEEKTSFQKFTSDLNTQKWSLYNISLFYIPSLENDPLLQNIVFFLPSSAGVWVVEYTDERKYPVSIRLSTNSEWNELLHNVGDIAINWMRPIKKQNKGTLLGALHSFELIGELFNDSLS